MKRTSYNKKKGVSIIADMLFEGQTRSQIVEFFQKEHEIKPATTDTWIRSAKPIYAARLEQQETEKRAKIKESNDQMIDRLGLSKEAVLAELKKLAFSDVRDMYDDEGELIPVHELSDNAAASVSRIEVEIKGANVLSKRVKRWSKESALKAIIDICGYSAPTKTESEITEKKIKVGYAKRHD